MKRCAFITGGSGFLGRFVVDELLSTNFERIYVLMRGFSSDDCAERLRALWWESPELAETIGTRVHVVCGDVTREQFGLDPAAYDALASEVTHIVHAAAEIGVNQTAERFAAVNVDGTANALAFADAALCAGGLEQFVHVSTAYVAGARTGTILEDDAIDTTFNSLYELSKFGAEQLVCDVRGRIPCAIVRPAQIVGDSQSGFTATFNTMYYPLKLYLKGRLPIVPVSPDMKLNMVPVNHVARVVARALVEPAARDKVFHAATPANDQPSVRELLAFVRTWAMRELRFDPGVPRFAPIPLVQAAGRKRNLAATSSPKRKSYVQNMLALAPYFTEDRTFDTANVEAILGLERNDCPTWRDYLPNLLAYAVRTGFLNHTGRTVFEQIIARLSSHRNTISYFDVSREGMRKTSAAEAKDAILRAAAALAARGIGRGDRVALVGVNSTRYFIADAAIGLVGAVSVPLYYTLPASDIEALVRKSGAVLLFAGTRALVANPPVNLGISIVSLLEDELGSPAGRLAPEHPAPPREALSESNESKERPSTHSAAYVGGDAYPTPIAWTDFLASDTRPFEPARVSFDSLATIRYTSGTTGEPKGVTFDQHQLRWMGEVMPALLDWRTRNGKLRYLSFLPMSHVVEGILVAYAPYYILSDIEMYYLNDFGALTEALPRVRPTLFFSVPRFYEKVWNQFEASAIGKRYLAMDEGPAKRALAAVARTGLLRKAGLDRCRQLIVGSAPVSMQLLQSFRDLGIEIHNAYGVTEAPLIALSRLGENELGSVGALLPETNIEIDGEGEVHVAGPQVTRSYDGQGSCLDERGFFATGDLGSLSERGNLVLGGRRKELLVTSYGKNISPEKIETLLKDIPGVSEALLVGEALPYVTALLWLEDEARREFDDEKAREVDAAVLRMNESLSHPEQVKRWAVMDGALSIAAGELTPNLKLRRRRVAELYSPTIEAIYSEAHATAPGALHVGIQG